MVQPTARPTTTPTDPTARNFAIETAAQRIDRGTAARRMYEQECALHDAHGSGIAAWIARAEHTLHAAILAYEDADTAR